MKPLTPKQLACAQIIAELTDTLGRPPTMREIAHEFGHASAGSVQNNLIKGLDKKGWLKPRKRGHACQLVLKARPKPIAEFAVDLTDAGREYLGVEPERSGPAA